MSALEKGGSHKLRISYSQKADLAILTQEYENAIIQTLNQLERQEGNNKDSNFYQLKPIIERRLQQFFLDSFSKVRGVIEFTKNTEKPMQKVILEPDSNLQKINEIKVSMLKTSLNLNQRQKYSDSKIELNIENPSTLIVSHSEGFKEDINETLKKNALQIKDFTECTCFHYFRIENN